MSAMAYAQAPLPPAPHRLIATVSPTEVGANEPSIAVNPNNTNQVVAAFQPAAIAYSTDGGQTFALADLPAVEGWRGGGDVSVAFDNQGRVYLATLHFDKLGSASYWGHGAGRNGIFVRRSLDGGKTWEKSAAAVKAFEKEAPNLEAEDMPRVFTDAKPRSPYVGNVYVGWIEWQIDQSIILFARSVDGAKTFETPKRISTHPGLPRDDNGGLVGFVGVVGADGSIYAIWNDGSTIAFTQSHDGGRTFTPSRSVIDVAPPYFGGAGGIPGVSRAMGFPQIAVGRGKDKRPEPLYVAWSDYRNGDVDVFCVSSADHGRSWSKPVRVNNDPIHDGIDQFFQWMTVDPVSGDVYVQFYDRRDDPGNRKTGFTLARSIDGAKSFASYAWAEHLFESSQPAFLGDYTWLTAYDRKVYGAWTEALPTADTPAKPERSRRPATVVRVGFADFSSRE
ncbi:MAG TPA: sialidase family protein [Terriglobales bacterium]|nr:sialidase family protein [Terriglobales bacterium]